MTATRKPRLDEDQREVLEFLYRIAENSNNRFIHAYSLQQNVSVFPIRPALDSLKRRALVEHDDAVNLVDRSWAITDAGREAIA